MLVSGTNKSRRGRKNMCSNLKTVIMQEYTRIDTKTGEIYKTRKPKFLNIWEIDNEHALEEEISYLPCGTCEQCRIDQSNQTSTRALIEAQKWPKNAFVTLTYDNEHLPKDRSLKMRDLQLFWKRLRKKYNIRYLACGEYGPKTHRPHYHAIIFNYWPTDCKIHSINHQEDVLYISEELSKIWKNGFCIVAPVNYETCAYVARYVVKKAFGITAIKIKRKEAEFRVSSRNPGIGGPTEEIWRNWGVPIKTKTGVQIKPIPNYTRQKMREENPVRYFELAKKNAHALKEIARAKMAKTELKFWQYQKMINERKNLILQKLDRRKDL